MAERRPENYSYTQFSAMSNLTYSLKVALVIDVNYLLVFRLV